MTHLTHRSLALCLIACITPSCAYLGDRGRDLVDPFRLVVGGTTGGGVRVNAVGLVHTGLSIGIKPVVSSAGLKYGRGYFILPQSNWLRFDADQSTILWNTTLLRADFTKGEFDFARRSFALLPAVFSWSDAIDPQEAAWPVPDEGTSMEPSHWVWSTWALENARFASVHAFDLEVELGVLLYLDLGLSPGEIVDLLLGILTIDIAGDDHP
ncbi:MAG: hypothetical protein H6834_08625 [Planctomycetes bacterium]|nr:hypothetical protein [Planctomycetota bacterium]